MKLIEGVKTKNLSVIPDERGYLMEILRSDDDLYLGFGQAYITAAYPGVVKGWHYHKIQSDNFTVIYGMLKIVLFDDRENSSTRGKINEFFMGERNPILLQIPPLVFHGFKCISTQNGIVLNIPTEKFNYEKPDEYRVPPHESHIPYDWSRKDG